MNSNTLLRVTNLKTHFETPEGIVRAVNGVSLTVDKQSTLGVLGESGCGKSVMAHSILNLIAANGKIIDGEILFRTHDGEVLDLAQLAPEGKKMRSIRGNEIAMIFQEPMSALSPVHTVGNQLVEGLLLHRNLSKKQAIQEAVDILGKVGIPDPVTRINSYTYELSGGMRQRAMIAMALACRPSLLIADEPTTALDVSIQAQILELIKILKEEYKMSVMLITHDLGIISEIADDVTVMYLGRAVESGSVRAIFHNPQHPYTQGLMKSVPRAWGAQRTRLEPISGTVPDAYNIPEGCAFHPRCRQYKSGICDCLVPKEIEVSPGHIVVCHDHEGVKGSV